MVVVDTKGSRVELGLGDGGFPASDWKGQGRAAPVKREWVTENQGEIS